MKKIKKIPLIAFIFPPIGLVMIIKYFLLIEKKVEKFCNVRLGNRFI